MTYNVFGGTLNLALSIYLFKNIFVISRVHDRPCTPLCMCVSACGESHVCTPTTRRRGRFINAEAGTCTKNDTKSLHLRQRVYAARSVLRTHQSSLPCLFVSNGDSIYETFICRFTFRQSYRRWCFYVLPIIRSSRSSGHCSHCLRAIMGHALVSVSTCGGVISE